MERYDREAVDTFMSITGVSESIAVRKLEEHGGNLNEAVNAHFSDGDMHRSQEESLTATPYDFMDIDDPVPRPTLPSLPFTQDVNPFSIFDSNIRSLFGSSGRGTWTPFVTHPREVREIPIEIKNGDAGSGQSGSAYRIEDVTELQEHGPEVHGPVIVDDGDDDRNIEHVAGRATGVSSRNPGPSAPTAVDVPDYSDDIEEEMIRAAIEASKQDVAMSNRVEDPVFHPKLSGPEDAQLAHAVSLSLQTAEQEKAIRELEGTVDEVGKLPNGRLDSGSTSFVDEAEDIDDVPLVRQGGRHLSRRSSSARSIEEADDDSPPSSPRQPYNDRPPLQYRGSSFPGDEWGGIISSEEHDEAVMLEAAMFGGIPEARGFQHAIQNGSGSLIGPPYARREAPHPPSPSLTAQRLLREQQDDEYLASLQADREKELKAKEEAEAALAEKQRVEAELSRKLHEEQENERKLAAKEASLPEEPPADDENAVTLLVRMPDGSRRGRRFLKSDKLQCLFDYIDIGRVFEAEKYRLVRPYPRRGFGHEDGRSSFEELGLSSKHEALYLELI